MPGAKHCNLCWRKGRERNFFFISVYILLCSSLLPSKSKIDYATIILKYITRPTQEKQKQSLLLIINTGYLHRGTMVHWLAAQTPEALLLVALDKLLNCSVPLLSHLLGDSKTPSS